MGKYIVQSVLLRRSKFTKDKAYEWMREHHYPAHKVELGPEFYHFRLHDPHRLHGGHYRTIHLGDVGEARIVYF